MINGAIEYAAQLGDGRVMLSGWARHVASDGARPVDGFRLVGRDDVVIGVTDRTISGTPGCGFKLVLPSAEDLAALRWGGLSLHACASGETGNIRFWERIKDIVLEIITAHLLECLSGKADAAAALRDVQKAQGDREAIRWYLDATAAAAAANESVLVKRGAVSHDSQVTIGRDGFLFLLGGSNGVMQQYRRPDDTPSVARWVALIRARQHYCAARRIEFRQMIVPEKQSIIPEFFPISLEAPTKLFAAITRELSSEAFFIDCGKVLRDLFISCGLHPFRKVDSHLSYFGAEALVREIIGGVGLQANIYAHTLREEQRGGDLGDKFFQGNMWERLLVPTGDWNFAREVPELVRNDSPQEGHVGIVMEWRARNPISSHTVLIFGNSMFERGGSPMTLSWWLSRIFARTRFVWSPGLQEVHVDDLQPSLLICQTVERFLPTLPMQ